MKPSIYANGVESHAARHMAEMIALAHEIRGEDRDAAAVRRFADGMTGITRGKICTVAKRTFWDAMALTKKHETSKGERP